MHRHIATLGWILALLISTNIPAQDPAQVSIPTREKFHLFLLAGQSNMAGRGDIDPAQNHSHPRILALSKDGAWKPAVAPIHFDKPIAGVGPGISFAQFLAEQSPDITIGLIPSACGGSPIATWEPGAFFKDTNSHPYDDALDRTRAAMKLGTLKAILWHQGESDCQETLAPRYRENLEQLIARFRKDLNVPNLPFVIGQLGQFEKRPWTEFTRQVNAAHIEVARRDPNAAFVSSDGLTPKSDNIHFDTPSQVVFGKRYAAAYLRLAQSPPP